jgi:hypothetical protein
MALLRHAVVGNATLQSFHIGGFGRPRNFSGYFVKKDGKFVTNEKGDLVAAVDSRSILLFDLPKIHWAGDLADKHGTNYAQHVRVDHLNGWLLGSTVKTARDGEGGKYILVRGVDRVMFDGDTEYSDMEGTERIFTIWLTDAQAQTLEGQLVEGVNYKMHIAGGKEKGGYFSVTAKGERDEYNKPFVKLYYNVRAASIVQITGEYAKKGRTNDEDQADHAGDGDAKSELSEGSSNAWY